MKFICKTEFIGPKRAYFAGQVVTMTAEEAKSLKALDKKKFNGALAFFEGADDEARAMIGKPPLPSPKAEGGDTPLLDGKEGDGKKEPTKAELIALAKSLGVKGADGMTVAALTEAIAAIRAKAEG
jgi:hypothetical protein